MFKHLHFYTYVVKIVMPSYMSLGINCPCQAIEKQKYNCYGVVWQWFQTKSHLGIVKEQLQAKVRLINYQYYMCWHKGVPKK